MSQITGTVCRLWGILTTPTSLINTGITLSVTMNTNLLRLLFSNALNVLSKDMSSAPVRLLTGAEDYEGRVTDGTGRLVHSTVDELGVRTGSARIAVSPLRCPGRW